MSDYLTADRWQDVSRAYWPWTHFTAQEMACKHTGKIHLHRPFMDRLQILRIAYGEAMPVSSGYRDPTHPIEARKSAPGSHAMGRAVDIGLHGAAALTLIRLAMQAGFTGIGVQQKGVLTSRFIHLDDLPAEPSRPRPHVWSY